MIKLTLHFAVISFVLLLSGCVINSALTSDIKPSQIDKILVFKPLARISFIAEGNKAVYSHENSELVMDYMQEKFEKYIPPTVARQKLELDSLEQDTLYREIYNLVVAVERNKKIKGIVLSDKLIELLEKNNHDYAIGALDIGFSRSKSSYQKESAKGLGIGLLTLGMYIPTPIKSSSTLFCFIIDKKNRNIAFYEKNAGKENDPTKKEVIDNQMKYILFPYFHTKVNM